MRETLGIVYAPLGMLPEPALKLIVHGCACGGKSHSTTREIHRSCRGIICAVEENPYKAPADSADGQQKVTIGRRVALAFMVPCILIAGYFFFAVSVVVTGIVTSETSLSGSVLLQVGLYFLNAATWSATAWAIWINRGRAVIVALNLDVFVLALCAAATSSGFDV